MNENTEKPALYPTKTRLRLVQAIPAGRIRHWHFIKPETRDDATDGLLTARVAELVTVGLATLGEPNEHNYSIVSLTPAGEEWLQTYGGTE